MAAALLLAGLLPGAALAQTVHYVDAGLATGAADGSSWTDAFQGSGGLQRALATAKSGDRVFVTEGVYLPTQTGSIFVSFEIPTGIELYGGFLGGENAPEDRPPYGTAPSVISGDLDGNDGSGTISDNSRGLARILVGDDPVLIDGFTFTGANQNSFNSGGSLTGGLGPLVVSNCVIRNNKATNRTAGLEVGSLTTIDSCLFEFNQTGGSGAAMTTGGNAVIVDCVFRNNRSEERGGALAIGGLPDSVGRVDRCLFANNFAGNGGAISTQGASYQPDIQNCVMVDNRSNAQGSGGAMYCQSGSSPRVRNCTIVRNMAIQGNRGGIATVDGASVVVVNSILWNNAGSQGAINALTQVEGGNSVRFCTISGSYPGTGNSDLDPEFVDLNGLDLRLSLDSPAVDSGFNPGVLANSNLDLAGRPRLVDVTSVMDTGVGAGPIVDRGAYELGNPIGTADSGCVPLPNSTAGPSTLVASGSLILADADLRLDVQGLPANSFAYFLMSQSTANTPVASGVLCLGGTIVRFANDVLDSGPSGSVSFVPDLSSLPSGVMFQAGETWSFQLWHRDGATSNFSSSLAIDWQ